MPQIFLLLKRSVDNSSEILCSSFQPQKVTGVEPISDCDDLGSKSGLEEKLLVVHPQGGDQVAQEPKFLKILVKLVP